MTMNVCMPLSPAAPMEDVLFHCRQQENCTEHQHQPLSPRTPFGDSYHDFFPGDGAAGHFSGISPAKSTQWCSLMDNNDQNTHQKHCIFLQSKQREAPKEMNHKDTEDDFRSLPNKNNKDQQKRMKKSVSFKSVQTRDYSLVIGDHPMCISGLPLSLGWSHTPTQSHDIDIYEKTLRSDKHRSLPCEVPNYRRGKSWSYTKLTYFERKNLLRRVTGLSESDILKIEKYRIKKSAQKKDSRRMRVIDR